MVGRMHKLRANLQRILTLRLWMPPYQRFYHQQIELNTEDNIHCHYLDLVRPNCKTMIQCA